MRIIGLAIACAGMGLMAGMARADTVPASCDVYPAGSDRAQATVGCSFSQRQGYITIDRDDGVTHDLSPAGDGPASYVDADGRPVQREDALGDQGLIFRFQDISLYVWWNADRGEPTAPTADHPYSTADYDATAILPCRRLPDGPRQSCPAGVLRMEGGQASVVVRDPEGAEFTINILNDTATGQSYVNATNRQADAVLADDVWQVTINGTQLYELPLVLVTGD